MSIVVIHQYDIINLSTLRDFSLLFRSLWLSPKYLIAKTQTGAALMQLDFHQRDDIPSNSFSLD